MKKIVSLILAGLIVAGLVPMMIFAMSDWGWSETDDSVLEITGNNILGDVTAQWIGDSNKIKTVEIGVDVTEIDNIAFINCKNLTAFEVDPANEHYQDIDGVLYTKDGKTLVCYPAGKTGAAVIAEGTETIASYAFRTCEGITSVSIPASVTTIGSYAFWGCENLASVDLGSGVTELGTWAFAYCNSLAEVTADKNANYASVDGVLYADNRATLVYYPANKAGVTYDVPAGVTTIKNYAFYGNKNLETITIPASVTSIGNDVFNYSAALTAIEVDSANTKYTSYNDALYTVNLDTLIYYPAAKTETEFTAHSRTKTIGKSAFENCDNLVTVNVGKNVTEIGYAAFAYCDALENINYGGREEQWNNVTKGSYWNRYLDNYKVTTAKFVGFTNADLTTAGSAVKNTETGAITVGNGVANKAYLAGGYQGSHFALSATFKVAEGSDKFSFVMGKDQSSYGYWAELTVANGKSYVNIYNNPGAAPGVAGSPAKNELGFDLIPGKEYTLVMTFDIKMNGTGAKQMKVEVFGDGDYYICTTAANAYGAPFYYSDSASCTVTDFTLTVDHYYDVANATVAVFGHSFVEGDSLGAARDSGFAYLLEQDLPEGTVMNFGLGGDGVIGMYNKMKTAERFIANCDYALLCIGTNDRSMTAANFKAELQKSIDFLIAKGITPILFTIPHGDYAMNDMMIEVNTWIRSSGYKYVDMYAVFANEDGSCNTDLFLGDKIHPSVQGHADLYEAIKTACPYIFE